MTPYEAYLAKRASGPELRYRPELDDGLDMARAYTPETFIERTGRGLRETAVRGARLAGHGVASRPGLFALGGAAAVSATHLLMARQIARSAAKNRALKKKLLLSALPPVSAAALSIGAVSTLQNRKKASLAEAIYRSGPIPKDWIVDLYRQYKAFSGARVPPRNEPIATHLLGLQPHHEAVHLFDEKLRHDLGVEIDPAQKLYSGPPTNYQAVVHGLKPAPGRKPEIDIATNNKGISKHIARIYNIHPDAPGLSLGKYWHAHPTIAPASLADIANLPAHRVRNIKTPAMYLDKGQHGELIGDLLPRAAPGNWQKLPRQLQEEGHLAINHALIGRGYWHDDNGRNVAGLTDQIMHMPEESSNEITKHLRQFAGRSGHAVPEHLLHGAYKLTDLGGLRQALPHEREMSPFHAAWSMTSARTASKSHLDQLKTQMSHQDFPLAIRDMLARRSLGVG